jgi:hypothetical protein
MHMHMYMRLKHTWELTIPEVKLRDMVVVDGREGWVQNEREGVQKDAMEGKASSLPCLSSGKGGNELTFKSLSECSSSLSKSICSISFPCNREGGGGGEREREREMGSKGRKKNKERKMGKERCGTRKGKGRNRQEHKEEG